MTIYKDKAFFTYMGLNPWSLYTCFGFWDSLLAAVLNIILSGLGYLYVGKRKVFGTLILVGELLAYVWIFTDPAALLLMSNRWVALAGLLFTAGLAIDAYNDAKES